MKRAGLVAAILFIAWLLHWGWSNLSPGGPASESPVLSSPLPRTQPLPALDEAVPVVQRSTAGEADAAAGTVPGDAPAERPPPRTVRVRALDRATRAPRADMEILLSWWPPDPDEAAVRGITDGTGTVELSLAAHSPLLPERCQVIARGGGAEQSFQALPLQSELVVLLEACTLLHGRVIAKGVPPGAGDVPRIWVGLEEPIRGARSVPVLLGRTQADSEGRFALQTCPSRPIDELDVNISMGSIPATRRISWETLAGSEGALIELELGALTVQVVDGAGAPLEGADVRVSPVRRAGEIREEFPAVGRSDARGQFRAVLEARVCEAIAGKAGFADAAAQVHPDAAAATVVLRLRPLGELDRVRGRVVRADGRTVADALVTAAPVMDAREAAMAAFVQSRSDEFGAFELAIAGGRPLSITAFHRDVGISDELHFVPDGRELELVIRAQGSLEVRIEPPADLAGHAGGLVEYALADRRFERVERGHDFRVPFEITEVPAGDYNLFVHVAAWNAYAEAGASVVADGTTIAPLESRPARFARGRVLRSDGSPATAGRITLEHPTWPPEVAAVWASSIDRHGRFELLLGLETSCSASLLLPGAPACRVQLHAGDDNDLRVD